jgi:hypothetical protein
MRRALVGNRPRHAGPVHHSFVVEDGRAVRLAALCTDTAGPSGGDHLVEGAVHGRDGTPADEDGGRHRGATTTALEACSASGDSVEITALSRKSVVDTGRRRPIRARHPVRAGQSVHPGKPCDANASYTCRSTGAARAPEDTGTAVSCRCAVSACPAMHIALSAVPSIPAGAAVSSRRNPRPAKPAQSAATTGPTELAGLA